MTTVIESSEDERPGGGCTSRLFTVLGPSLRSSGNQYSIDKVSTKDNKKSINNLSKVADAF